MLTPAEDWKVGLVHTRPTGGLAMPVWTRLPLKVGTLSARWQRGSEAVPYSFATSLGINHCTLASQPTSVHFSSSGSKSS